jgi:hypothetical protein
MDPALACEEDVVAAATDRLGDRPLALAAFPVAVGRVEMVDAGVDRGGPWPRPPPA